MLVPYVKSATEGSHDRTARFIVPQRPQPGGAYPARVLPFDEPADQHYADIRAALERAGTPIGNHDLFIAAHARSRGMTLVTHNTRDFERVSGLSVEDWMTSAT